jgi:transposase
MRKSFDSLSTIVAEQLKHDPLSGHLFIFTSKAARSREGAVLRAWRPGHLGVAAKGASIPSF